MDRICLIGLTVIILGFNAGWAGNGKNMAVADPAYLIHLDKSFYVNGEVIWYKLLMPADARHRGIAVKAVITDRQGQALFYTFLKNRSSAFVTGYYKIPFDLAGGVYRLSFLASDAGTGQSYSLAYVNLPIYNDSEPVNAAGVRASGPRMPNPVLPQGQSALNVRIDLNIDTIHSRDQLQANFSVTDAEGRAVQADISLAVSDQALVTGNTAQFPTVVPGLFAPVSEALDTNLFFKAQLTDYSNRPLTANVIGVLAPRQNRIHYTRTTAPGRLLLRLPDFYAGQPFQFLGLPEEEDSILVRILPDEGLSAQGELTYTPEVVEYLELSRKRKKIYQLYNTLEFNLQPEVPAGDVQTLKPERTVNVKNYESFDNVYLFFREILTPLVFRQVKNEIYEAKIFTDRGNSVFEMLPGAPLFIIDGQATRDGNYIAHMKMDMIEKVAIFTDRAELRQQFNVMGKSGVAILETSSADLTVPDPDADDIKMLQGLQAPAAFPALTYEQFENDRHRPFFRPQLHWDPNLHTGPTGQAFTSFYQSDARGNFRVQVIAHDGQGRIGYAEKTYFAEW